MTALTTPVWMVRAAVGGHVGNTEIFLPTILADVVGLLASLVEFLVVLRTFWMTDATIGL